MVGGVIAGTRGGGFQLTQLLMSGGIKCIELDPGLFGLVPSFSQFSIFIENFSLKNQLICNANDL